MKNTTRQTKMLSQIIKERKAIKSHKKSAVSESPNLNTSLWKEMQESEYEDQALDSSTLTIINDN